MAVDVAVAGSWSWSWGAQTRDRRVASQSVSSSVSVCRHILCHGQGTGGLDSVPSAGPVGRPSEETAAGAHHWRGCRSRRWWRRDERRLKSISSRSFNFVHLPQCGITCPLDIARAPTVCFEVHLLSSPDELACSDTTTLTVTAVLRAAYIATAVLRTQYYVSPRSTSAGGR